MGVLQPGGQVPRFEELVLRPPADADGGKRGLARVAAGAQKRVLDVLRALQETGARSLTRPPKATMSAT
jgi:hypothetical protein